MVANLTARAVQFIVGVEDWSNWVESWQFAYNPVDPFDTVFKVTGQVVLSLPSTNAGLPSNPDRRFNPTQWARGQNCSFKISPEYTALPQIVPPVPSIPIWAGNALKLLRIPNAPFPTEPGGERKLTLDLGCVFALEDWDEPAADKSGIVAGVSTDRTVVLANILSQIGLTTSFTAIPYPLTFPAAKLRGSFVAQVGEIAAAANHGLYVDVDGTIKNFPIDLTTTTPIKTITIGQDEEIWRPIGNISENPPAQLTIAGIAINSTPAVPTTTTTIEESRRIDINPNETYFPNDITIARRRTVTFNPFNGSYTEIITLIEEPRITVNPDETLFGYDLIVSKEITVRQYYNSDGTLSYETEITRMPRIAINPDETLFVYDLTDAADQRIDYSYSSDKKITTIKTLRKVPRIKVSPDETFLIYDTTPEFEETTNYTQISGGLYQKTITLREPRIKLNPNTTSLFYDLVVSKTENLIASDGSAAPPNTTYRDPDAIIQEVAITTTITPTLPPYSDWGRTRQATIDLDYVTSVTQLEEFGKNYLRILLGRNYSWQLQCPIYDVFLTARPLSPVTIVDGTTTWRGYLDAMEIRGNINESYFNAVFIENGSVTPTWSV